MHIVLCRKAMLDAADLKVPKTPCKTSAGLLAKLQTNKSATSQAALEQREAHRQKDEHRRRKQLKVQLPEGCETAHDQSHGLIHDVAEMYTECPGEDLRENERRGAAHGKAAQSCAVQPFMGPQTRAALASLSSSLEEWQSPSLSQHSALCSSDHSFSSSVLICISHLVQRFFLFQLRMYGAPSSPTSRRWHITYLQLCSQGMFTKHHWHTYSLLLGWNAIRPPWTESNCEMKKRTE